MVLPMLALTAYLYNNMENKPSLCHKAHGCAASSRQMKKGMDENKVRFFGNPEQIFKRFASKGNEDSQGLEMSYKEFFHALTPYNYGPGKDSSTYFKRF